MDDSSEIQSDIIDRYVNEILHVFTQLKNITISVQQRLGAKKPAWIPLQPNGTPVRSFNFDKQSPVVVSRAI